MNRFNRLSGLTLIELLIGIAIACLIMFTLTYITMSTSNTTNQSMVRNNLIKEGQIAQQIISGRLSEAVYVWPSGITPNIVLTSSGVTTKNTVDPTATGAASFQWKYGNNGTVAYYNSSGIPYSQLFVAMILPPVNPSYNPATGAITNCISQEAADSNVTTTDTNAASTTDGCYRFFAYYPMRRSYLTSLSNSDLAASNKPIADSKNDIPGDATQDRWVLMEFRANLYDGSAAWNPNYGGAAVTANTNLPKLGVSSGSLSWNTKIQPLLAGRSANVLVDYVKPNSVSFTVYRPGSPDASGKVDPTLADASGNSLLNTNNGHVDYTFQLEKIMGDGKKVQATNNNLGGSIVIKNWYCPKAMKTSPFALNCP